MILAAKAQMKTKYGFKSFNKPYGIPTLASPKGEILQRIVIINSLINASNLRANS